MTLNILPNAKTVFLDTNSNPLSGGSVYMYIVSTTTPKTTWQDPNGVTPNSNPIILDGNGSCLLWGSGSYRQVVKDSLGNLVWDQITIDPGFASATSFSGTSTSSVTIGTGTKSFTTQPGLSFFPGGYLIVSSNANNMNYMVGAVTSYNTTTGALVMNMTFSGGSGTHADWNISVTGIPSTVTGSVSSVSIATANGFSGSSSGGSNPALTIVAGDITPNTVNALTLAAQTTGFTIAGGATPATFTYTGATGTGNVMYSASPTTTGTLTGNNANFLGVLGVGTASPGGAFQSGVSGTTGTIRQVIGTRAQSFFGIYDSLSSLFFGLSVQLPAPSGTSCIGGYFGGMGVGGATNMSNNLIFGVLTSTQSGYGIGNVAMTVTDNNQIFTFNSTLDDGSGNTTCNTFTANKTSATNLFLASLNSTTGVNGYTVALSNAASGTSAGVLTGFKLTGATYSGTVDLSAGLIGLNLGASTFTTSGGAGGNIIGVNISQPVINGSGTDYSSIYGILVNATSGSNGANVTNGYGIQIANQGGLGQTSAYGINISHQTGATSNNFAIFCTDGFSVNGNKNVTIGTAVIATNATTGFLWIPSCAGAPTGTLTAPYTGATALVYDSTDSKLYANFGGTWKSVTLT